MRPQPGAIFGDTVFLFCNKTNKETIGVSNVRNFDINFHVTITHQPLSLLLALSRRLDAEPSITDNSDKKIELSDDNLMEPVTRKSSSLLNTCRASPVKYALSEK